MKGMYEVYTFNEGDLKAVESVEAYLNAAIAELETVNLDEDIEGDADVPPNPLVS